MHLYEAPSDLEKLRMELCGIVNESDFEPVRELLLQCEREFAHDKRVKDPVVLDLLARGQKKQEKAERKRWLDKKIEERRGRDSLPDPVPEPEPEPEPESQMGAELESEVAPEGDPTRDQLGPRISVLNCVPARAVGEQTLGEVVRTDFTSASARRAGITRAETGEQSGGRLG